MSARASEGAVSAQRILREVPIAEVNDTVRTFSRTLEQAFGPGERGPIADTEPMHPRDKLVVKASGLGLAALAVMAVAGVLQ